MADSNTIRILSLDGGGERGYLSLKFLQQFVSLWGINPSALASYFDVICGTSIGGIMSLAFASGRSPNEIEPFFLNDGPYIFTEFYTGVPPIIPSQRPSDAEKLAYLISETPFYQSSGSHASEYGGGKLISSLTNFFGDNTMADLQTNVLIPSYQKDTGTFVSFSNWSNQHFIGQNELIKNVALATSAAPVYLPSVTFNNHIYTDGGVYLNNPALMGLSLGKMIKPNSNRCCIFSLGTGLEPGKGQYSHNIMPRHLSASDPFTVIIQTLGGLLNQASSGSEESVAETLLLTSQYTLDQLYYYRFQPIFNDIPTGEDVGLDNTSSIILDYYANKASDWYTNDLANITTFLGHLTA